MTDNDTELTWPLVQDAAQCRAWRSETLTAITNQQPFKSRRARFINRVAGDLASLLAPVAPRTTAADLRSSLRRTIVEPAADLAHKLHLSSNPYSLKWPARGAYSRLEVYECLDLAGGGIALDLSGTTPTSAARRKVSYLFDIAPGLFVERIEAGKKTSLKAICRPTVLVHGGDGEPAQQPTVLGWLCGSSAVLEAYGNDGPPRSGTPKGKYTRP